MCSESFQTPGPSPNNVSRESEDPTPLDVAEQELQAYAEEYAALADFEDIPPEELFSLSDVEELENPNGTADDDVDMS
ncbi:hypothetical protein H0H93_000377 [Arthromyces matolae]|nr:hypothetical protein H0H93_000377 [Arthromyces matolae]